VLLYALLLSLERSRAASGRAVCTDCVQSSGSQCAGGSTVSAGTVTLYFFLVPVTGRNGNR
jgi:hypothetical protein